MRNGAIFVFIFNFSLEVMYGSVMLCGHGVAYVSVQNGVANKMERCDNNGLIMGACFSKFVDGIDSFIACVGQLPNGDVMSGFFNMEYDGGNG